MKFVVFAIALLAGSALGQDRLFEAQAIVQQAAENGGALPTLRVQGGEYDGASKNLPAFEQPKQQTLPVRELTPHLVQYPVKATEERKESHRKEVTENFIQPILQRVQRQPVPVQHISVSRTVQPVVNRVIQPVMQKAVEEVGAAPAQVAEKKHH